MRTVVGVHFKPVTKVYHFDPQDLLDLKQNDFVIVSTAKGNELVQVAEPPHLLNDADIVGEMKSVVRRATAWDLIQKDLWKHKEQEALALARRKAQEQGMKIKIVRCEYNFDGGRLMVYFSAENRIDFRTLVRELARIFRTRVEMRQIGVRDEAKLLDGVGKCGRQLCCTSWLREFTPVSIRMAKNQQLPLNPDEISGVCGRLLCCLSYEDATYKAQNKKMPKLGSTVVTPQGSGRVRHVHPLKETVTVMLDTSVLTEFGIEDLITKKKSDSGCSTCGGCTVKRRGSAEEDNAKVRAARSRAKGESSRDGRSNDSSEDSASDSQTSSAEGGKRQRRSRRDNK